MSILDRSSKSKKGNQLAVIGLLSAVPALLLVSPLIGLFAGQWIDDRFGTEPIGVVVGVVLGLSAAAREIYNIVKKAEKLQEKDKDS
ncbi:MAG: AtpZ/AtpI family protein [Candidatus Zixiibacteriota bacterium]